mgnify:CR=1 FL=1
MIYAALGVRFAASLALPWKVTPPVVLQAISTGRPWLSRELFRALQVPRQLMYCERLLCTVLIGLRWSCRGLRTALINKWIVAGGIVGRGFVDPALKTRHGVHMISCCVAWAWLAINE